MIRAGAGPCCGGGDQGGSWGDGETWRQGDGSRAQCRASKRDRGCFTLGAGVKLCGSRFRINTSPAAGCGLSVAVPRSAGGAGDWLSSSVRLFSPHSSPISNPLQPRFLLHGVCSQGHPLPRESSPSASQCDCLKAAVPSEPRPRPSNNIGSFSIYWCWPASTQLHSLLCSRDGDVGRPKVGARRDGTS